MRTLNSANRYKLIPGGILYLYLLALLHWFGHWWPNRGAVANVVQAATDTPFMQAGPRFSDFFQILYASKATHPYLFHATDYPPGALVVTRLFGVFPDVIALAVFVALCIGLISGVVQSIPTVSRVFKVSLVLCFPVMFAVDRGNLDLLAVALVLLATYYDETNPTIIGLLIGIAVAIKLWPIVFIFAFTRRIGFARILLWAIVSSAIVTFVGQLHYGGSLLSAFAVNGITDGPQAFTHSTTLISALSLLGSMLTVHGIGQLHYISNLLFTRLLCFSIGGMLLLLLLAQRKFSKRLLAASLIVLLIPSVSFMYRDAIMLVPLVAELTDPAIDNEIPPWWIVLSWIVVFSPTAFWYSSNSGIGTDSLIVPAALLVLGSSLEPMPLATIKARLADWRYKSLSLLKSRSLNESSTDARSASVGLLDGGFKE